MTNSLKVVETADGSHTLFVPGINEHYHSTFGAIAESRHIFIDAGFRAVSDKFQQINVFEVGFGTGLNALLTQIEAKKSETPVIYTSIEANPLEKVIWSVLNYPEITGIPGSAEMFEKINSMPWGKTGSISSRFDLLKIHGKLEEYYPDTGVFHLVYFDAFAPDIQPSMWSESIFRRIYDSMVPGGVLVTYSVKGKVVRSLKNIGFKIEKLPGPPGKRHMLRVTKL